MNQTLPHCVNQMGKTHSKPLAARHGRGTAWARLAMCESALSRLDVRLFGCVSSLALWFVLNFVISSLMVMLKLYRCPTTYQTRHFFNNSNSNEDIATKFEHQYVLFLHISCTMRRVRFKFRCNILISGKIIKEMTGLVASGTPCTYCI
jgi:hypothetical protein